MKRHTAIRTKGLVAVTGLALMLLAVLGGSAPSQAGVAFGAASDIRVWLEDDYDIYPSMNNVVFCVRAARDCHALIYIVDTDGFIHVVHPFSPYESAWIEGGYTYRFSAAEAGLYGFDFDRGIAFIFAIGSPHPFLYTDYGIDIFAGRFAYRIYGDPFYACKRFYISLLPRWCNYSLIGVSYAHFYVRDRVRYPWYLCSHHTGHRTHGRCAYCDPVYERYRYHASDPYRILSPTVRYKGNEEASLYSMVAAVSEKSRAKILHERGITPASTKKQPTLHKILRKSAQEKSTVRIVPAASTKGKIAPKGKTMTVQPPKEKSVKQKPVPAKSRTVQKQPLPVQTVKKPAVDKKTKIQSPVKSVVRSSEEMVKREKSRTQALKKTVRTNSSRVGHEKARAKTGASKTKVAPKKADRTKKEGRQ